MLQALHIITTYEIKSAERTAQDAKSRPQTVHRQEINTQYDIAVSNSVL